MTYVKIERAAARAREVMASEVALDAAPPGVELFESLDEIRYTIDGKPVPIEYAVEDLPSGVEAQTRYIDGEMRLELSRATYHDLERGVGRARHTLFHEIGHLILHRRQLVRISVIPHADFAMARATSHRFFEDTEWQADAFAAAFEMPARGLARLERRYGALSPSIVQSAMKVSAEAARVRIGVYSSRRAELLRA